MLNGKLLSTVAILAALGGSVIAIEDRYAKAFDLDTLNDRLEIKILEDEHRYLRRRLWAFYDKYCGAPYCERAQYRTIPLLIRQQVSEMEADLKRMEAQLQRIHQHNTQQGGE